MPVLNVVENETKNDLFKLYSDKFDNLQSYNINSEYDFSGEDDDYYPTHVAILIPFNGYCIIITITGLDQSGNLTYEFKGTISNIQNDENEISFCHLWFLDNENIHIKFIKTFKIVNLNKVKLCDVNGRSFSTLICDKKFISTVIRTIFNYYCTDRSAYQSFNNNDEPVELEL